MCISVNFVKRTRLSESALSSRLLSLTLIRVVEFVGQQSDQQLLNRDSLVCSYIRITAEKCTCLIDVALITNITEVIYGLGGRGRSEEVCRY